MPKQRSVEEIEKLYKSKQLSVEEIEELSKTFKENLMGECERLLRRGDHTGALTAVQAKEYIDKFVLHA